MSSDVIAVLPGGNGGPGSSLAMTAIDRAILDPPQVEGLTADSSMSGLERRTVGYLDLVAQSVGAVAPTAAAATLPALIAAQAGSSLLLCLALAWLLVAAVAYAVGQFTRRMAAPGSLYTFATLGLGRAAGFGTASAAVVGYAFVSMFALVGAALSVQTLLVELVGRGVASRGLTGLGVLLFGVVCLVVLRRGIRISARVTLVVEVVSLSLVLSLIAVVLTRAGTAALAAPFSGGITTPGGLVAGTTVAITSFVGFESVASLGREARQPFLTVPRTMRLTLIAVGLVYLLSAYTQQVGVSAFGLALAGNDVAMSSVSAHAGAAGLGRIVAVGQTASFLACAIASLTALTRVVFSLGREGVLPRALGRADPLRGTPMGALVVAVPVTVAVPELLMLVGLSPWQAMATLIGVSGVGYVTTYAVVCCAAPRFLRRIGELTWSVALVGYATGAVLVATVSIYLVVVAGSQPAALVILLLLLVLGVAGHLLVRARRPGAYARMGLFDETTAADVLGGP